MTRSLSSTSSTPLCKCGHTRGAHYGQGPCLVAMTKTPKAKGSATYGSVCPCQNYRPKGTP